MNETGQVITLAGQRLKVLEEGKYDSYRKVIENGKVKWVPFTYYYQIVREVR